MTLLIFYLLLAVLVSFFCSVAEAVLLSVRPSYIALMEAQGSGSGKKLKKLCNNLDRPLAAILTANTIAHTVGATGVGAQAAVVFGNQYIGLTSAILTFLILIFSEIIPKTIGAIYSKSLLTFAAFTIRILMIIAWPFVIFSEATSKLINKCDSGKELKASREELLAMAEISEDEGSIDEQEGDIIENLIKLDGMPVEDIMTPRSVIFALVESDTVGKVIDTHSPIAFSRIPVYEKDLDNITGIVNRYTLVNKQAEDQFDIKIKNLMSPIHSIVEKTSVSDVLDLFVKRREQMFMVTDDFGTTTGLITLEDAIETLLGVEIVDEHDHVIDMRKLASAKLQQQNLTK